MERAEHRELLRATDADLQEAGVRISAARARIAAAEQKYTERLTEPTPKRKRPR